MCPPRSGKPAERGGGPLGGGGGGPPPPPPPRNPSPRPASLFRPAPSMGAGGEEEVGRDRRRHRCRHGSRSRHAALEVRLQTDDRLDPAASDRLGFDPPRRPGG